jgi:hypothetical protein
MDRFEQVMRVVIVLAVVLTVMYLLTALTR